jgi:hypothetical protein
VKQRYIFLILCSLLSCERMKYVNPELDKATTQATQSFNTSKPVTEGSFLDDDTIRFEDTDNHEVIPTLLKLFPTIPPSLSLSPAPIPCNQDTYIRERSEVLELIRKNPTDFVPLAYSITMGETSAHESIYGAVKRSILLTTDQGENYFYRGLSTPPSPSDPARKGVLVNYQDAKNDWLNGKRCFFHFGVINKKQVDENAYWPTNADKKIIYGEGKTGGVLSPRLTYDTSYPTNSSEFMPLVLADLRPEFFVKHNIQQKIFAPRTLPATESWNMMYPGSALDIEYMQNNLPLIIDSYNIPLTGMVLPVNHKETLFSSLAYRYQNLSASLVVEKRFPISFFSLASDLKDSLPLDFNLSSYFIQHQGKIGFAKIKLPSQDGFDLLMLKATPTDDVFEQDFFLAENKITAEDVVNKWRTLTDKDCSSHVAKRFFGPWDKLYYNDNFGQWREQDNNAKIDISREWQKWSEGPVKIVDLCAAEKINDLLVLKVLILDDFTEIYDSTEKVERLLASLTQKLQTLKTRAGFIGIKEQTIASVSPTLAAEFQKIGIGELQTAPLKQATVTVAPPRVIPPNTPRTGPLKDCGQYGEGDRWQHTRLLDTEVICPVNTNKAGQKFLFKNYHHEVYHCSLNRVEMLKATSRSFSVSTICKTGNLPILDDKCDRPDNLQWIHVTVGGPKRECIGGEKELDFYHSLQRWSCAAGVPTLIGSEEVLSPKRYICFEPEKG